MRARDVMSSPVVTVTPLTTVQDAADLLVSDGFTTLPALDEDGALIGVVTEGDVIRDRIPLDSRRRRAYGADAPPHAPAATVGEAMTSPVVGMGAGTDVVDLVTAMLNDRTRTMPIVDGSRVVGVVTWRDLLRAATHDGDA